MEIRFVGVKKEQRHILKACHVDPMSRHMGVKRTLNRISERFIWAGMVKDVNDMVSGHAIQLRLLVIKFYKVHT